MPLRPTHLSRSSSFPRCRGRNACPYRASSVVLAVLGASLVGGLGLAAASQIATGLAWL